MKEKTVKLIALITGIAIAATTIGTLAISVIYGR
mgnify:CR=1 FL=1